MFIFCSLLTLIVGYLLLVYASKQAGFLAKLGTGIAWLTMVLAVICFVCGMVKIQKHGWGYQCSYTKRFHKYHHGKAEHPGEPMMKKEEIVIEKTE